MEVVYEGELDKNGVNYEVRRLIVEDIESILNMQDEAAEQLVDKDVLQTLSREEYEYILGGKGLMVGAFIRNELIAFRALLVPPTDEEYLGRHVGLADSTEQIIYQEISIVHPDYRGNRLQQKLATLIMEELNKSSHGFQYVCCTVAPFNIPSLKDKFNQGMKIGALIQVYEGKLRYVFVRRIHEEEEKEWEQTKKIPMDQTEKQQELLQAGWVGNKLVKIEDTYVIQFVKKHE